MDSPETWRWIWLGAAFVFAVGEMASAGTFFLLPFAIAAAVGSALAFAGVALPLEWLAFVILSFVGVVLLRPFARRITGSPDVGVGARRWVGQSAKVLEDIPAGVHETGLVRIGREEWRAESATGTAIPTGAVVTVADVLGTRLVVVPAPAAADASGA